MRVYFFNINIAKYKYSNNNDILEYIHNYSSQDDSNIPLMILINENLNHFNFAIPNAEINQYNYNVNKDLSINDNVNNKKNMEKIIFYKIIYFQEKKLLNYIMMKYQLILRILKILIQIIIQIHITKNIIFLILSLKKIIIKMILLISTIIKIF